jgi:hypothetical protein
MPFIIESRRGGRPGARRFAVAAAVVSMTLAIGSVLMLAGAAGAATGAGLAVGSLAASPSWKIQSTPNPAGSEGNSLEGVSCTSATACTAVGSVLSTSGEVVTRAERWNGTSWKTQTTPNPKGAGSNQLNGVSCSSATACTAVGYYYNTSGVYFPLAEGWNGTTWTIHTAAKPSGSTDPELEGVSCTSASACTAAGGFVNSSGADRTLAERWNGTSWTTQTTTNPGAESNYLYGASCTSASACTAVGYQQLSSSRQVTLAERWNGTAWTTQTTPNPSGPDTNVFSGVSCASASACTAVGYYDPSNAEPTAPFAEGWNGTAWTLHIPPSPAGTDDSPLNGVSCTAASTCTAVGEYQDSSGIYLTLAERESA